MLTIVFIIVLLAVGVLYPRFMRYVITAPLVGTSAGGFVWALVSIVNSDLVTITAFTSFIACGLVLAEIVAVFWPWESSEE